MMTQSVQGLSQGIAIFGSIPVRYLLGMSYLKSLQCLVDHAPAAMAVPCSELSTTQKYKITHAFSPDPGWGPGIRAGTSKLAGSKTGSRSGFTGEHSSCCSQQKKSSKIPQLKTAVLQLPGEEIKLPIISGTEDEQAIDITPLARPDGLHHARSRVQQHGSLREQDHVHRRRERGPALPRLSDRGAGRAQHVRRDGLAADLRRAADGRPALQVPRDPDRATSSCTRGCVTTSRGSRPTVIRWRCSRR